MKSVLILHDVYAYDVTPATIDANMFTDIVFINEARLMVPVKSGHLYANQIGWNVFAGHIIESIETSVKTIEDTHVTVRETSNGVIVDGLQVGLRYVLL